MSVLSDERLVRVAIDAMAKVFPEAETGIEQALADLAADDTEAIAMVAALRAVADAAIATDRAARGEPVRYTSDGALAECPCCGSLDVGGVHDTVYCDKCGLNIKKPRPLQNAIDAWNRRKAPPAAPVCMTCNGHGLIGGFVSADSGYDSLPCPDCNPPAAPVVPNEEGKHCGDPDCVPCRDPAEPVAPVVPEGWKLVPVELIEKARRACGEPHPHEQGRKLILTAHVEALESALDEIAAAPAPRQEPK